MNAIYSLLTEKNNKTYNREENVRIGWLIINCIIIS